MEGQEMKLTERLILLEQHSPTELRRRNPDGEAAVLRIERLEAALRSIAANTCCDNCQEAATVARAALAEEGT